MLNETSLQKMAGGALQEKFQQAFEEVMENVQNPNTSYRPKRQIIITMDLVPDETRSDIKCLLGVKTKLAPVTAIETSFMVEKDLKTNKIKAHEYGRMMAGQQTFESLLVDKETGEIIEECENKSVVNFRKEKVN